MEASRKLGFSAKQTMQLAQRLYEGVDIGGETVGLITYMRTDGVTIIPEAINAIRGMIEREYSQRYVPPFIREYKTKAKNAQEAHEAIRPTDVTRTPAGRRQASRPRPGPPLRADLEAHGGEPDGLRRAGADHRRHRGARAATASLRPARHRLGRACSTASSRSTRKAATTASAWSKRARTTTPRTMTAAACRRSPRAIASPTAGIEAEQHFTQPPPRYHRGDARQAHGGARHRPPLHLRLHARRAAGARLRPHRQEAPDPRGQGPARHGLPGGLLQALRRVRLHGRPRGEARPHLRRQARVEGRAARLLARLHGARRRDQGPARRRGAGGAQRAARPAHLPAQGRGRRPAPVPELRRGPPQPQDRGKFGAFIGCSQLSRVPLSRASSRSRATARRKPPRRTASCSATIPRRAWP